MNGGVSTDGIDSYTCTCAEGYTGVNCDESMFQIKMIDTAQDNIIIKSKNYSRSKLHWKSSFLDIDDCASSPCQNGGKCIDGVASFTCQCDPGWAGDVCDESKYNVKKI